MYNLTENEWYHFCNIYIGNKTRTTPSKQTRLFSPSYSQETKFKLSFKYYTKLPETHMTGPSTGWSLWIHSPPNATNILLTKTSVYLAPLCNLSNTPNKILRINYYLAYFNYSLLKFSCVYYWRIIYSPRMIDISFLVLIPNRTFKDQKKHVPPILGKYLLPSRLTSNFQVGQKLFLNNGMN